MPFLEASFIMGGRGPQLEPSPCTSREPSSWRTPWLRHFSPHWLSALPLQAFLSLPTHKAIKSQEPFIWASCKERIPPIRAAPIWPSLLAFSWGQWLVPLFLLPLSLWQEVNEGSCYLQFGSLSSLTILTLDFLTRNLKLLSPSRAYLLLHGKQCACYIRNF